MKHDTKIVESYAEKKIAIAQNLHGKLNHFIAHKLGVGDGHLVRYLEQYVLGNYVSVKYLGTEAFVINQYRSV